MAVASHCFCANIKIICFYFDGGLGEAMQLKATRIKIVLAISAMMSLLAISAHAEEASISLINTAPESVAESLNKLKSASGTVLVTPGTNKIYLIDQPDNIAAMKRYISVVDANRKQVMIEARIMETTDDFSRSLGVNWGVHSRGTGRTFPGVKNSDTSFGGIASVSAPTSGVSGLAGVASDIAFGVINNHVQIDMRINAAESADLVKVVSSPKIATQSGRPAKITQGKLIPYISSTSDKVETRFVEASLALEVTPSVREDGKILMRVMAKNDAPDTTSTSSTPPIDIKQAITELVLNDGQSMVIGGIMVNREETGSDGVPWVMNIPILGNLFKSSYKENTKKELMVVITPRVLPE